MRTRNVSQCEVKVSSRAQRFYWGWLWRGRLNWLQQWLAPAVSNPGRWGEWVSLLHLRKLGWDILARNWRVKQGELDLVAFENDTLVFIEVKTRSGDIRPEENFTVRKQRQFELLADIFRIRHELQDEPFRCDLIAIESSDFRYFELRHWTL